MTSPDLPVAAHEIPGFLKCHIEGILLQYAHYMNEVVEHQRVQGLNTSAVSSLSELRKKTSRFIDSVCETITSSTEAGELLRQSLEAIMQKIDIYRVMKAAFSGALNQGNKTTIDYASSCILPAALQLPLNLVIVNQVSFDVLNYMSLRPGSLVCMSRGPTPTWLLNDICTNYLKAKANTLSISSKPLQHRLCVVTRIWFENSILPEDAEAFLMTVPIRRQRNPFFLDSGAETLGDISEEDVLAIYGPDALISEPVTKLDLLFKKRYASKEQLPFTGSDLEASMPSDLKAKIIAQAKDIPQKVVRNDKYTRTQMDRGLLRLITRFRLELLDIHDSELPPDAESGPTNPAPSCFSPHAPLESLQDIDASIHSSMPWLKAPLRLSYGKRYVIDAQTATLADLSPLLDPYVDQMVFCPLSNSYCLAYNKLQKRFRVAYVHDSPTRENRFHARISWVKAKSHLAQPTGERHVTVQIDSLDSVHLFDVDTWLAENTVYDCACCTSSASTEKVGRSRSRQVRDESKTSKPAAHHMNVLIFARFLAPLPSSTRLMEVMYDDIFPTVPFLKKPKRKFYANVMRTCIEFTE
ncbi:Hypothetical protein DHA2_152815 [Giardia duodenalis]|uniref:Uncharacterized protein n=1 Tax=Giardia intestinalis TaxID=5741 RepID=V6TE46_GIAIN|nr:Hypothetical protein DHA2_152815 [Giardia intestinalis]